MSDEPLRDDMNFAEEAAVLMEEIGRLPGLRVAGWQLHDYGAVEELRNFAGMYTLFVDFEQNARSWLSVCMLASAVSRMECAARRVADNHGEQRPHFVRHLQLLLDYRSGNDLAVNRQVESARCRIRLEVLNPYDNDGRDLAFIIRQVRELGGADEA